MTRTTTWTLLALVLIATPKVGRGQSSTAGPVQVPERKHYDHNAKVVESYDKFSDTMAVFVEVPRKEGFSAKVDRALGLAPALQVVVSAKGAGQPFKAVPPAVYVFFRRAFNTKTAPSDVNEPQPVDFLGEGGVRLHGTARYLTSSTTATQTLVTYALALPVADFESLANGNRVDTRALGQEFTWEGAAMEALKDFGSRIVPAGVTSVARTPVGSSIELGVVASPGANDGMRSTGAARLTNVGSSIRVLQDVRLTGAAGDASRFMVDTGTTRIKPSTPCGRERLCAAGWDLVASVSPLAGAIAVENLPFPVAVTVENRGRLASSASEARLSLCEEYGECASSMMISIPPLAAGEKIRIVTRPTGWDAAQRTFWFRAEIDPDQATTEINRSNNVAESPRATLQRPSIEWVTVNVKSRRKGEPVVVELVARNPATVASSPSTEVNFSASEICYTRDAQHSVTLPRLGPRESASFTLAFELPEGCGPRLVIETDLQGKHRWDPNSQQGLRATRDYLDGGP